MAARPVDRRDRTYHHGALRDASLAIALEMLRAGDGTPTLRSVARSLGVSATALYRHFPNHYALLAAAGRVGYERLARLLPLNQGSSPADDFALMVKAYVDFALENRSLFEIMFDADLQDREPGLDAAARSALDRLKSWLTATFSLPEDRLLEERLLCLWTFMQGMAQSNLSRVFGELRGQAPEAVARRFGAQILIL